MENFKRLCFDCLIAVGGDGSIQIAYDFYKKGIPVICVPKTIDNDLGATVITFGFDTAVSIATEAIDRLHSTAKSHDRVMVVEVMGRTAAGLPLTAACPEQRMLFLFRRFLLILIGSVNISWPENCMASVTLL